HSICCVFFFQAEDGIRDFHVTGVQTCALPIFSAEEIAWHTEAIARSGPADLPLVLIDPDSPRGSTDVFVYAPDRDNTFAVIAATFDRFGLDIQDARITGTRDGYTLDSSLLLEADNGPVPDPEPLAAI